MATGTVIPMTKKRSHIKKPTAKPKPGDLFKFSSKQAADMAQVIADASNHVESVRGRLDAILWLIKEDVGCVLVAPDGRDKRIASVHVGGSISKAITTIAELKKSIDNLESAHTEVVSYVRT
jgi:hypothetical protein